ncbi:MAG TPA: aromatic ring-hydroxylating dioxygenase subunit alpha [Vicinamibacteria bacterium]|nr:aromatic ring-hydroxylating dioxygenase subunit alpha [Vicinamibacteria bacterium]
MDRDDGDTFEPDLAAARTIPARWYFDPAVLDREERRVFARTWQLVGAVTQVRAAGDYFTCRVGREPLVVARDEAGTLRALSNVCRHRAGPVARGAGRARSLQCGYHGWTYALDGRLLASPEFEGVRGFDRSTIHLPEARLAEWGGFLFVNLDRDAPALGEFLGAIPHETRGLAMDHLTLRRRVDYEVECNWKVYVDNYLEGYHIPRVHPALFRELDYGAYRVETARLHSRQRAPLRREGAVFGGGAGDGEEALYYWVFPNLMLNVYPGSLQTNLVVPLGPERTLTRFEWYVAEPLDPAAAEKFEQAFAFSDQVQREDMDICRAVQQGLRSATYHRGRYSVLRENGVHHFHGLLSRFLAD